MTTRFTPRIKMQIIDDIQAGRKALKDFDLSLEEFESWKGRALNELFVLPKSGKNKSSWYRNHIDKQHEST